MSQNWGLDAGVRHESQIFLSSVSLEAIGEGMEQDLLKDYKFRCFQVSLLVIDMKGIGEWPVHCLGSLGLRKGM